MQHPSLIAEAKVEPLELLLQVAWAEKKLGPQWGVPPDTMASLSKHTTVGEMRGH